MPVIKPLVTVIRAGRISYKTGLQLQNHLAKQDATDIQQFVNYLIIQEHNPPVYTIGIRDKSYTSTDETRLRKLGAEFYRTNRGGLITFHGPGQLVAYPILQLQQFQPSMRWFVRQLELTIIDACCAMGVTEATTTADTGIWVGNNKICAIGVHGARYVTTHGIALNCCTDLKWFDYIVPCGLVDKGVTSLSNELARKVAVDEAAEVFIKSFAKHFDCRIAEQTKDGKELLMKTVA